MNEAEDKQVTLEAMAECMDMVRGELIEAGIVDQSVPPMMVANAVLAFIARDRAERAQRAGVLSLPQGVVDKLFKGEFDVAARKAAAGEDQLPKWIDDQKGKDPSTDDLIEEIIRLRGVCRQIAAVEGEEVKQLRATVDKRQHDVLREALACIEYYESKELADSVRAILNQHGQQIGAYRPPVHVTLAGIHNASIYFDWSREATGFGQLSISKREDGTVTCMNECMGREFIRNALHAAMDALVDAAVLEER